MANLPYLCFQERVVFPGQFPVHLLCFLVNLLCMSCVSWSTFRGCILTSLCFIHPSFFVELSNDDFSIFPYCNLARRRRSCIPSSSIEKRLHFCISWLLDERPPWLPIMRGHPWRPGLHTSTSIVMNQKTSILKALRITTAWHSNMLAAFPLQLAFGSLFTKLK